MSVKQLKLTYALKDGEIVSIEDVKSGLNCGCICPACSDPLVAKKGEKRNGFCTVRTIWGHSIHFRAVFCLFHFRILNGRERTVNVLSADSGIGSHFKIVCLTFG